MAKNSAVIERRIRPIYEFLDIGNHKRAQQEADKLLKKQPDFLCAKALKLLSFIRCGRAKEAEYLLNEVESVETDEEFTLQALTYCYRDLGKSEKVIALYENALKKQPHNEEFLSHLVMAYVRTGQYKQQNQMAIQLYKLKPKNHLYYFWSVVAIVLQAHENPSSRPTFLALAEKMMQKCMNEGGLTTESELKFYCMILELSDKLHQAIELLTSDLATKCCINQSERNQKLVDLYFKLEKSDEIFRLTESMLNDNPDDWFAWCKFIESGVRCARLDEACKDSIVEKMAQVVLHHTSAQKPGQDTSRAAYLARLKLIEQLLENDLIVKANLGEPAQAILQYFRLFGGKPCCFVDLRPFLSLLDSTSSSKVIEQLGTLTNGLDVAPLGQDFHTAIQATQIRSHTSALKLALRLGLLERFEAHQIAVFIKFLISHYQEGLKLDVDLGPTDLHDCDEYLLVAVICALKLFELVSDALNKDVNLIFEIITLLEYGMSKSPANFKFKMVAAKVYAALNCAHCLQNTVESMKIKYVMHESLWFFIADHLSPAGYYSNLLNWCKSAISFGCQSQREITDNMIQCYKSASFDRILEFLQFRQKISNSFLVRACRIWSSYFSLVSECFDSDSNLTVSLDVDPFEEYQADWSELTDNRDLQLWNGIDFIQKENWRQDVTDLEVIELELKFYDQLVHLIALASNPDAWLITVRKLKTSGSDANICSNGLNIGCANFEHNENASMSDSTKFCRKFDDLRQKLAVSMKKILDKNARNSTGCNFYAIPISGYGETPFSNVYSTGSYFKYLQSCMDYLFTLMKGGRRVGDEPKIEKMKDAAGVMMKHQNIDLDCSPLRVVLMHVSYLVQTNGLILIMMHLLNVHCLNHAHVDHQQQRKTKKKKQPTTSQLTTASTYQMTPIKLEFEEYCSILRDSILSTLKMVSTLQQRLDLDIGAICLSEDRILSEEFISTERQTINRINDSYNGSLNNFRRLLGRHKSNIERIIARPT